MRQRRRSETGTHWCSKPDCIRKKNRFYRKRQADLVFATLEAELFAFFRDVVRGNFTHCANCGQERGLVGWMHPSPDWARPCRQLGAAGLSIPNHWLEIAWPK